MEVMFEMMEDIDKHLKLVHKQEKDDMKHWLVLNQHQLYWDQNMVINMDISVLYYY